MKYNWDAGIKNFLNFLKHDTLGAVANLHSKIADKEINATNEPDCLFLSDLHNICVDFGKHGQLPDDE